MHDRRKPPDLRVVEGEGRGHRKSRQGQLLEVQRPAPICPIGQLPLPGFQSNRNPVLISGSVASLAVRPIREFLRELQVRRIIDIRIAPSFLRLGLAMPAFLQMLQELGISYSHWSSLANRFAGLSSHPELLRSRFALYLEDRANEIRELRSLLDEGPVLLIGADPRGPSSDRDILLGAMARLGPRFELQYLPE
jgi:hypothetical protein